MTLTLWHNPRCSTSRKTLDLLKTRGIEPALRLYLKDAPTVAELTELHGQLGRPVIEWTRTKEAAFAQAGLSRDSADAALIAAIAAAPVLLERPILVAGDRAILGRPPEAVLQLL